MARLFTKFDDKMIVMFLERKGKRWLAERIGKTGDAVVTHALELRRSGKWDDILNDLGGTVVTISDQVGRG